MRGNAYFLFGLLTLLVFKAPLLCAQTSTSENSPEELPPDQPLPTPNAKSTEAADQRFIIHGSDRLTRSRLLQIISQLNTDLESIIGESKPQSSIVIELIGKNGDPVPPRTISRELLMTSAGYRLQLNLHLGKGISVPRTLNAVLDLMLIERSLHDTPAELIPERLFIPPWLREGLIETIAWKNKRADRAFYNSLLDAGGLISLDDLLNRTAIQDLDAGTRTAFRASASTLLQSLLSQSEGKQSFNAFLKDLPSHAGEQIILLRKHFSGLNLSPKSLLKWWQLQLVKLAQPSVTETMTMIETEKKLSQLLQLNFEHPEHGALNFQPVTYLKLLELHPELRQLIVKPAIDQLSVLIYRAFPDYKPIFIGYASMLRNIATHPVDAKEETTSELLQNTQSILGGLARDRALMKLSAYRVRDYLDWYHINTASSLSGEFNDYLNLREELQNSTHSKPSLSPVSRYLDDIEPLFRQKATPR